MGLYGIKPEISDNSLDMLKIAPELYSLEQNYPNPFNPSTKVYDVLGKVVATLVNENKPAGYYTTNFEAGSLSSGIYFYTITANGFFDRKKMILLR